MGRRNKNSIDYAKVNTPFTKQAWVPHSYCSASKRHRGHGALRLHVGFCPFESRAALVIAAAFCLSGASLPSAQAGVGNPDLYRNSPDREAAGSMTEEAFALQLRPIGTYQAGLSGRAEVILQAKHPYHVNQEFPLILRLQKSPYIGYSRTTVTQEFARIETQRAIVPIEFTPRRAGKTKIGGSLKFSVCNTRRCLVEARDVEIEISVQHAR